MVPESTIVLSMYGYFEFKWHPVLQVYSTPMNKRLPQINTSLEQMPHCWACWTQQMVPLIICHTVISVIVITGINYWKHALKLLHSHIICRDFCKFNCTLSDSDDILDRIIGKCCTGDDMSVELTKGTSNTNPSEAGNVNCCQDFHHQRACPSKTGNHRGNCEAMGKASKTINSTSLVRSYPRSTKCRVW